MDRIVERLILVEEEAKKMVEAARLEEHNLNRQLEREQKEIEDEIFNSMKAELDSIVSSESVKRELMIKEANESGEKKIYELEAQYKAEKDKWVDEIVTNIVGTWR